MYVLFEELNKYPGHLIRRLQQIHLAIFAEETAGPDLTSMQFSCLFFIARRPMQDQRALAHHIGADPSTAGGIIDRLEKRQLIKRIPNPFDRRMKLMSITEDGKRVLEQMMPMVDAVQVKILNPLSEEERATFTALLERLVRANNHLSRAPAKE